MLQIPLHGAPQKLFSTITFLFGLAPSKSSLASYYKRDLHDKAAENNVTIQNHMRSHVHIHIMLFSFVTWGPLTLLLKTLGSMS